MIPQFDDGMSDSRAYGAALKCSECGNYCLHHFRTEVFERSEEDSPTGLHVQVELGEMTTDTDMSGNPSRRRNGVRIYFSCENCPAITALNVLQHKGTTFLSHDLVHNVDPDAVIENWRNMTKL